MDATTRLLTHGTDKQAQVVTSSELSALLTENEIPPITVIKRKMGVDKDGKRNTIQPWNSNFIAIKPAGVIGEIQPAIEDSELIEEDNVDYINAGNGIRISKWRTGASTGQTAGEYTEGAARLLPLITEMGQIICAQVRGFAEKEVKADETVLYLTTSQSPNTTRTQPLFHSNPFVYGTESYQAISRQGRKQGNEQRRFGTLY